MARGYGLFGLIAVLVGILLIAPFIKRFVQVEGYVTYSNEVIAYANANKQKDQLNTLFLLSDTQVKKILNETTDPTIKGYYQMILNGMYGDNTAITIINTIYNIIKTRIIF